MWLAQEGERQKCEDTREEDIEADVILSLSQAYGEYQKVVGFEREMEMYCNQDWKEKLDWSREYGRG